MCMICTLTVQSYFAFHVTQQLIRNTKCLSLPYLLAGNPALQLIDFIESTNNAGLGTEAEANKEAGRTKSEVLDLWSWCRGPSSLWSNLLLQLPCLFQAIRAQKLCVCGQKS